MRTQDHGGRDGQATVELALSLPVVVVLLLLVVQVGLVARDQLLVLHAAREAAREAAVDAAPGAARRAALGNGTLASDRLQVDAARGGVGGRATVRLRYASPTDLPMVGRFLPDVDVGASVTMRVES